MKLLDRFETVNGFPALYVADIDALVIADLHLGLESLMAKSGTYMPRTQLAEMKEDLEAMVAETDAERVVVCGDVKHEFSETSYGEREEVQAFVEFLSDLVQEILLVKGNHDNYLIYAVEEYKNVELAERFILDDICFVHGHEPLEDLEALAADSVVIGHEHPALALKDAVGVTEKLPCFLYGEMKDGRNIVVLPAFSKLADGSQVNVIDSKELNSPVLRQQVDFGRLKAAGVDREAGVLAFPELEKLHGRSLGRRN